MNIHEIHDLSNSYVTDILINGLTGTEINYSPSMAHCTSNLFYILEEGRYKTGSYFIVEENGKYIASAGWNKYTEDIALVLTRAYVAKSHRMTYVMGNFLLPKMLEQCSHFKHVWITCNEHNKNIYEWFVRTNEGKAPALFNNWPDIYSRFEPIGKREVYYTEQYVVELKK